MTGIITLAGVLLTRRYYKKRDEQKREDEKRRILREERKKVYGQFIAYMIKTDAIGFNPESEPPINNKEYFDEFISSLVGMKLFSPKIDKIIGDIMKEKPFDERDLQKNWAKTWKNLSREFKTRVVPLMQEELSIDDKPNG